MCNEEREMLELFQLLKSAKCYYYKDVVSQKKSYERYVEDFVNRNTYIDCDMAVCKNIHRMNLNIVNGILSKQKELVKEFVFEKEFYYETFESLMRIYNGKTDPPTLLSGSRQTIPLSFGCSFTRQQIVHIANCARENYLFCISDLTEQHIEDLFSCRFGFQIRVRNIRLLATLFDCLLEMSLIDSNWKSTLHKGCFLLNRNGDNVISASNLSSSLSAIKRIDCAAKTRIRLAISKLVSTE